MCGIAGIVTGSAQSGTLPLSNDVVKRMAAKMVNRGPDAYGVHTSDTSFLLHTRLKIQDLSDTANQPWISADKSTITTFNGEIYNFKELRDSLTKKGFAIKTRCDTEVLVQHMQCHGYSEEGLKALNGMFAFATYEPSTKRLILVRDRLGIKPMFYCYSEETQSFAFASNIGCLLATGIPSRAPSDIGLSMYLSFRSPIGAETMFKDIKMLLPGHMLIYDGSSSLQIKQYWDIPVEKVPKSLDVKEEKEAVDLWAVVRRDLEHSIRLRMIADVPFCSYLSGGVDSSAVTAIMQQQLEKMGDERRVNSYTIGFPELNEFEYAAMVAERYKTVHSVQNLSCEDYFEAMTALIVEKGEPLGVPNEVPLYIMSSKLKSDGFTVVLSGEGADELFQGYGRIFKLGHDYERVKRYEAGDKKYENFAKAYEGFDTTSFGSFFFNRYTYVSLEKKYEIMNDDFIQRIDADREVKDLFLSTFDRVSERHYQDQISYAMLKMHLPVLLRRCDNCTMATSVEGRVPFVDHTLVESVFNIAPEKKMKWASAEWEEKSDTILASEFSEVADIPKAILKEAVKEDLPSEVISRKKMGFPVPLKQWFANEAKSVLRGLAPRMATRGIFKESAILSAIDSFSMESSGHDTYLLWGMLNMELWHRLFIDLESKEQLTAFIRSCLTDQK